MSRGLSAALAVANDTSKRPARDVDKCKRIWNSKA